MAAVFKSAACGARPEQGTGSSAACVNFPGPRTSKQCGACPLQPPSVLGWRPPTGAGARRNARHPEPGTVPAAERRQNLSRTRLLRPCPQHRAGHTVEFVSARGVRPATQSARATSGSSTFGQVVIKSTHKSGEKAWNSAKYTESEFFTIAVQ